MPMRFSQVWAELETICGASWITIWFLILSALAKGWVTVTPWELLFVTETSQRGWEDTFQPLEETLLHAPSVKLKSDCKTFI